MKQPVDTDVAVTEMKTAVEHIDDLEKVNHGPRDKFGSAAKVDTKEIALVRKLDIYIMVRLIFA